MIAKIFGLFSVNTSMYASMDFVIMENVSKLFNKKKNYKVTFDMKGSSISRRIALQEQFWKKKLDYPGILKDLNFVEISNNVGNKLINLQEFEIDRLRAIFEADSKFLADNRIMDYSCLLTIETNPDNGQQHYHWGIIDYLQEWTMTKKMERAWKTKANKSIVNEVSAIPCEPYQERFIAFMKKYVLKKQDQRVLTEQDKARFIYMMK